MSLSGAPPLTVATEGVAAFALAWGDDGFLYTTRTQAAGSGIAKVPAAGGELESLTQPDTTTREAFHSWQQVLPGSTKMIATIGYDPASNADAYRIAYFDLESGDKQVIAAAVLARYSPSGHLVYVTADGQLLAARFDPGTGELGAPAVLADGVAVGQFGSTNLAIGGDGTLLYTAGSLTTALGRAVWVDRSGGVTPVDTTWQFDPGMPEAALVLSPDGSRLAVKISTDAGEDIWVKELPDG
ncbi:MAG: hypothetical protein GWN07_22095, partial [Actinobacteria bacterium]|nr:hypothetical protein [Actinomycetota bacterium]NIX22375.1 hypothetical protein [Actinomycetota bacterium]